MPLKPEADWLPEPSGRFSVGFADGENDCVIIRFYYPSEMDKAEWEKRLGSWLPSSEYLKSYGYYLRMPNLLYQPLARFLMSNAKQWAAENIPPLEDNNFSGLVIFSHGLGGIRTTYSALCCDLASQGYLVAAIEHRDGSASMTIDGSATILPYRIIAAETEEEQLRIRQLQLQQRGKEVQSVIDYLSRENVLGKPVNFNNNELILMGHSFGAATMIQYATQTERKIKVIGLDPWMYAMPPQAPIVSNKQNLLIIDMEKFQWPENAANIMAYVDSLAINPEILTVLGGDHKQCSDLPLLKLGSFMIGKGSPPTKQVINVLRLLILIFILEDRVPPDILAKYRNIIRKMAK